MLQFIRERAQSWFAWVIVVLIIVPFALWGIHQYFGGGKEIPAAKVNDVEIPQQRLQQALYQQQMRLREMLGENFNAGLFSEQAMRQQVLEGLIEQELLLQTANSAGMRLGNAMLATTIHNIPAFQRDGEFSPDNYEMALRASGLDPRTFEADLYRDMLVQQLHSAVARSEFATRSEIALMQGLLGQKRDIRFIHLPVSEFTGDETVSEDEVTEFYSAQGNRFMQAERVSVNYLELSANVLADAIEVSEMDLQARYEAGKAAFTSPEERRARHILIQVPVDADDSDETIAREKIEKIAEEIRGGGSFEELATSKSEDPVSAEQGGDLGFFGRNMMDKAFEEASFALQPGEMSEPVRSQFGYHLILLEEARGGETQGFDEVREQLLREVRNERAEQKYFDLAEQLASLTYEHPESLDEAASELDLPILESALFSRDGGEGVLASPRVSAAAFSEDVLARGNNSEAIEVGRNHMIVLRIREHLPEALRPLDEVRDEIVAELKQSSARQRVLSAAADLLQKLQSGEPVESVEGTEAEWQLVEGLKRGAAGHEAEVVRRAFAMPRPQDDKPVWDSVALGSGDVVVLGLLAVHEVDVASGGEEDVGGLGSELAQSGGEAAFDAFVAARRATARISRPEIREE